MAKQRDRDPKKPGHEPWRDDDEREPEEVADEAIGPDDDDLDEDELVDNGSKPRSGARPQS